MERAVLRSGLEGGWRARVDRTFRSACPRIGGAVHGPWCGANGFLGRCDYCGALIYFWTCKHLPIRFPFEAWTNGRLEEGYWAFHNDGYCLYSYEELRSVRQKQRNASPIDP